MANHMANEEHLALPCSPSNPCEMWANLPPKQRDRSTKRRHLGSVAYDLWDEHDLKSDSKATAYRWAAGWSRLLCSWRAGRRIDVRKCCGPCDPPTDESQSNVLVWSLIQLTYDAQQRSGDWKRVTSRYPVPTVFFSGGVWGCLGQSIQGQLRCSKPLDNERSKLHPFRSLFLEIHTLMCLLKIVNGKKKDTTQTRVPRGHKKETRFDPQTPELR